MKDKQDFIDAMDLQQDADGHWFVNGVVWGDGPDAIHVGVLGEVWGSVKGNVRGNVGTVEGNVKGTINGRKWQYVEENEWKRETIREELDSNYLFDSTKTLQEHALVTLRKREAENKRLREDCKFLLSFAPKDAVPEVGHDHTFYYTGTYGGDLKLQERIDGIKAALEENNDEG